jgi:hypothetical protein
MINVKQYTFPTLNDGILPVERMMNYLSLRRRRGYKLDNEEQDWLDWAEKALYVDSQFKRYRA